MIAGAGTSEPDGAPLRIGFVGDSGDVVVWRDGEPVVLATIEEDTPFRALETAYGIAALGSDPVLVGFDGAVRPLNGDVAFNGAVSEDGTYLLGTESHSYRNSNRPSTSRAHLTNLADGSRQTMPWEEGDYLSPIAVLAGVAYLNARPGGVRWEPGARPELLDYRVLQVDVLTGTILAEDGGPGVLVVSPDRTRHRVTYGPWPRLVPGAQRLYNARRDGTAIMFVDLPAAATAQVRQLPEGCRLDIVTPGWPVWEDAEHLLIADGHGHVTRLAIESGRLDPVPLIEQAGQRPVLIEPLLRRRTWPGPLSR